MPIPDPHEYDYRTKPEDQTGETSSPLGAAWTCSKLNRGARIRTGDLGHPKAARYQAAPRPEPPSLEPPGTRAETAWRQPLAFAAMADVRPFNALHYDLGVVGSLEEVAAPPYDVIDTAQRAELLARSPYNAVAIDLPKPLRREPARSETDDDPYEGPPRRSRPGARPGRSVDDPEPAIWALTQDYTAPDGSTHSRHGILARVRVEDYGAGKVRPHERTLPGPKAGPARPDPRHPPQPLADLLAQHRGRLAAGRARDRRASPGARRPTNRHRQPRLAGRRPGDPRRGHASASPTPSC